MSVTVSERAAGTSPLAELADEKLCTMAAERSEQAFKLLVQRHQARAYRIAYSMLGDESEARGVSQDAFIQLFKSAHRFDARSGFSLWFYRRLVNLCVRRRQKWWRRLLPFTAAPDKPGEAGIDPRGGGQAAGNGGVANRSSGCLEDALKRISANQRLALLLKVQEGFTRHEIAGVLRCSENAALLHVQSGLTALRKLLGNE